MPQFTPGLPRVALQFAGTPDVEGVQPKQVSVIRNVQARAAVCSYEAPDFLGGLNRNYSNGG
ncbi:MAG: hypothetical protein DMG10_27155 [Acidobacteria bacterium]|nr:MAG: hypothetical protein DMG10_27155 [Acidobacteriota bacterium]